MARKVFKVSDGDIELGDYPYRIDQLWVNVIWIITQHCNLGCKYCIGWQHKGDAASLLSVGQDRVLAALEKMRADSGLNFYLTLTGGEPTIIKGFPEFCGKLVERGFVIELQTNLTTAGVKPWIEAVSGHKENVAQVVASYHGWALDNDLRRHVQYMENLRAVWDAGILVTLKTIVLPGESDGLAEKVERLRKEVPRQTPILTWPFIHGVPRAVGDWNHAYPYCHTDGEKRAIIDSSVYRRHCKSLYMAGAGFHRGMECDAGRGFVVLDWKGDVGRCSTLRTKQPLGNLMADNVKLLPGPTACPSQFCSTPFWAMWYGRDPWRFVPGAKQAEATYCRFGPVGKDVTRTMWLGSRVK